MRSKCMGMLMLAVATMASAADVKPKTEDYKASTVNVGNLVAPRVVPPCKPGHCPFAGQGVTYSPVPGTGAEPILPGS